jgi:hypothetical protein
VILFVAKRSPVAAPAEHSCVAKAISGAEDEQMTKAIAAHG